MRCFQETCILSQVKSSWGWKVSLQWLDISLMTSGGNIQVPRREYVLGWQLLSIFKAPLAMAGVEIPCKCWYSEGWTISKRAYSHRLQSLYSLWVFTEPYLMCTHTYVKIDDHLHPHPGAHVCVHTHICSHTHAWTVLTF